MEQEEVNLLAERYYKSDKYCHYNVMIGDYETVKPVDYQVISERIGKPKKFVQKELKGIEQKLGVWICRHQSVVDREQAVHNVNAMERLTLAPFTDEKERAILKKAFDELRVHREDERKRIDDIEIGREMLRLRARGIY